MFISKILHRVYMKKTHEKSSIEMFISCDNFNKQFRTMKQITKKIKLFSHLVLAKSVLVD